MGHLNQIKKYKYMVKKKHLRKWGICFICEAQAVQQGNITECPLTCCVNTADKH